MSGALGRDVSNDCQFDSLLLYLTLSFRTINFCAG